MQKRNTAILSLILILALGMISAPVWAQPLGRANTPVYYLSLGTSLAAGVQADFPESCESVVTDFSYPGFIAEYISADQDISKLRHVNLGCPEETSDTFIDGGLCNFPHGSQLEEALNFLHAHGKFTGLITIDLGANDALPCFDDPSPEGGIIECFAAAVTNLSSNLSDILNALQQEAPGVPIVGMNYYNPLLLGDPGSAPLQDALNAALQVVYGTREVPIPVADVAGAFSATPPGELALLCDWTWMCDCFNIHPNVYGYEAIANAFNPVLPYIQISESPRRR